MKTLGRDRLGHSSVVEYLPHKRWGLDLLPTAANKKIVIHIINVVNLLDNYEI